MKRRWIELAIEMGEWNFRNNWETCERIIEEYNFVDDVIDEEGYDYAMDYATDMLIEAFDYLRKSITTPLWRNYNADGSFDLVEEKDCNNPYPPLIIYDERGDE